MKSLRVGLKTGDLIGLDHKEVTLTSQAGLLAVDADNPSKRIELAAGHVLTVVWQDGMLAAGTAGSSRNRLSSKRIDITTIPPDSLFTLKSAATSKSPAKSARTYKGRLEVSVKPDGMRLTLVTGLETYVQGVLQSEVPAYFKLEAMKAQAVVARTYGLHPRLSHAPDNFNVCDSYLHCQAFNGLQQLNANQQAAISSTAAEILTYDGAPALALFSACAGGHTESYEYCFSDPITDAFPPPAIPYLSGVPEGTLPAGYPSEEALRVLFATKHPATDDAWSASSFRWQVDISADALEAHMHHYAKQLMKDPQFSPFIHPAASGIFGHIKSFTVTQRGVAGTAMHLQVDTTSGAWIFDKELTIRSLFENPDVKLKRLKSARIFFNHKYDHLGLLHSLEICGFGSGHGVGLQQVGAQGLADRGENYRQILSHYYRSAAIGSA